MGQLAPARDLRDGVAGAGGLPVGQGPVEVVEVERREAGQLVALVEALEREQRSAGLALSVQRVAIRQARLGHRPEVHRREVPALGLPQDPARVQLGREAVLRRDEAGLVERPCVGLLDQTHVHEALVELPCERGQTQDQSHHESASTGA